MITDKTKATGQLKITVTGPDGKVKEEQVVKNLVVTTGLNWFAERATTGVSAVMTDMAVGTGVVAAAISDTTLGTELARVVLTSTVVVGSAITYTADYPAGTGTGALTEAGIFNAAVAGTMLSRTVFPVVNKGAADAMTIGWTVTLG